MNPTFHPPKPRDVGMSLVLTLVIVATVAIVLTMFARLAMSERRVSSSYATLAKAEMAAAAGLADASNLLLTLFEEHPDSVTFWDPAMGSSQTPGTVFAYRDIPANRAHVGPNSRPTISFRPLVSGASTQTAANLDDALTASDVSHSVDLNDPRLVGVPGGWIGKLPSAPEPTPIHVPWVEILEDPSVPKSADNPAVTRYAYWIEDESFKLNINKAQPGLRDLSPGASAAEASLRALFEEADAANLADNRIALVSNSYLSESQIGHVLGGQAVDNLRFLLTSHSGGLDLSRSGARRLGVNQVVANALSQILETEYVTGRTGPDLRDPTAPAHILRGVRQIRSAIEEGAPLFGNRAFRNTANVPNLTTSLADRTWKNQLNLANANEQEIYLDRIATNIFDLISPAPNPTAIMSNGQVLLGGRVYAHDVFTKMTVNSMAAAEEPNPFRALGKRPIPYLTEYVMHAKQISFERPGVLGGLADYDIEIDHYFEFWNMSDQHISPSAGDLGPEPYFVLQNQGPISVNTNLTVSSAYNIPAGRDFEIKLSGQFYDGATSGTSPEVVNLEFPPNSITIITTDPNWKNYHSHGVPHTARVFVPVDLYIPGTDTSYTTGISMPPYTHQGWDEEGKVTSTGGISNVRRYRGPSFRTSSETAEVGELRMFSRTNTGNMDPLMRAVMGNSMGLLDITPSIRVKREDGGSHPIAFNTKGAGTHNDRTNIQQNHFRGSFLEGNRPNNQAPRLGLTDPRGKMDTMQIDISNPDFSTFRDNKMGVSQGSRDANPNRQPQELQGSTTTVKYNYWPISDSLIHPTTTSNAPAQFPQGGLQSIGQLGNVFDPVVFGTSAEARRRTRPGGSTLSIGQPDPLYDGSRNASQTPSELGEYQLSSSREWAAWRLADLLTIRSLSDPVREEGLYNPNGILRDDGRVLRALLEGLVMDSTPRVNGSLLRTDDTHLLQPRNQLGALRPWQVGTGGRAIANYLAARLARPYPRVFSPLWERGEISQLTAFSLAQPEAMLIANRANNTLAGRDLEEIGRRIMGLLTTRGDTFSVYLVGESLDRQGNVVATNAQRVTLRLKPHWDPELLSDFNPDNPVEVRARFRRPDRWTVEILSKEQAG